MTGRSKKVIVVVGILAVVALLLCWWCGRPAQDEAMAAGLTKEDFRQAPARFYNSGRVTIPYIKGRPAVKQNDLSAH